LNKQTQEKEKSLTELMLRIFKEPLKPLGESVHGLGLDLSEIKAELELISGSFAEGLKKSDTAARQRSKDTQDALSAIRDEQGEGVATVQSCIAEHAQVGTKALEVQLNESRMALAQSERHLLDAIACVSEDQRGASHNLGVLASQLGELSGEFKKNNDAARVRSTETLSTLQRLRDEQAGQLGSLTEHAQAQDVRLGEIILALAQSERHVLDAVARVEEDQRNATHSFTVLCMQLSDNRTALDNALLQLGTGIANACGGIASDLKAAVAETDQRLEQQYKASRAVHHALLSGMKGAAESMQSLMAENLRAQSTLRESMTGDRAGIIDALNQYAEALNARLDQSQAKLRHLTITMGLFVTATLAYLGYELLGRAL